MKILFFFALFVLLLAKPVPFKECHTGKLVFKKISVEIEPDIIRAGTTMITRTNETSNEVVTGGVNINQVYYLGVQVSTERYDICQATVGGCPIRVGNFKSETKSTLPNFAPRGTYKVIARDRDRDGRELSCIEFEFKVE